jgi:hypothetical protein
MTLSDILALPDGSKFGPVPLLITECKTALTKAKADMMESKIQSALDELVATGQR